MQNWSGTARKLAIGFGALVFTIAVASFLTLAGLRRALELASAVRDEYAHQAHTIIIGNESHLGFYLAAERRVLELSQALRPFARGPEECGWMDDIEHASKELDGIFRQRIVPAVVRGDRRFVQTEHARAQLLVTRIQDLAEQLVGRFEARISTARAEVSAVERRTNRSIIALLIGAPLLAAAITFHVGRSIAKPIARLSRGAERLAAGDLDTKIDIPTRDEFGAGLDARARARLFEPFFTTKERGTGLGLAVSRAIARAHGGDIEAASTQRTGATFTLKLPRHEETH